MIYLHPEHGTFRRNPGVVIIVLFGDYEVLQILHAKRGGWELPAGMSEDGESLEIAAARELLEETGLVAESATLLGTKVMLTHVSAVYSVTVNSNSEPRAGSDALVVRYADALSLQRGSHPEDLAFVHLAQKLRR